MSDANYEIQPLSHLSDIEIFAEVRGKLHTSLGPSQREPYAVFIPQLNAPDSANEGTASTDGAVGAGKVADLPYA